MKTKIFTVIATSVSLAAATTALAVDGNASKAAAQVAFHEPEKFTDFRMTEFFDKSDAEVLQKELTRAIERSASANLPPGYTLNVRFTDIDLAGDINPFHRIRFTDVREYRGVYPPRMTFDYTVTDAEGNEVVSGSERLLDMAYDMRLRLPSVDYTRIEAEMLREFVSKLSHNLAKANA